jgi:hypothetical protein
MEDRCLVARIASGSAHADSLGDGEYATMPDIAYGALDAALDADA